MKGKLIKIYDTQHISDKFQKREFILEVNKKDWTEPIKFQLIKDRCQLLDDFVEGDIVEVEYDIKGRKWDSGNGPIFFVDLMAWKITNANDQIEQGEKIPF